MNGSKEYTTLYFVDSAINTPFNTKIFDPNFWLTRHQPFYGVTFAKAFFGPQEKTPMYIEVDGSAPRTLIFHFILWSFYIGAGISIRDDFDKSPFVRASVDDLRARAKQYQDLIARLN